MKINVLTLFPEYFESPLKSSIVNRAIVDGKLNVDLIDFRNFSTNKHRKVDDTQYGGGAGMVLSVEPIHRSLMSIEEPGYVVALTPTGNILNDSKVNELVKNENLTIICGHYEGFDERVYNYVDEEISIGDYVLFGGESASLVLIDTIVRKIDGVINKESIENDSFATGLLDYPAYTKPVEYDGHFVPEVLLSGNHQKIEKFRYKEALRKTFLRRKDLIDESKVDFKILQEIIDEESGR